MEKTAKKSKKVLKIVIIVLVVLAVVITAGLYALSVMIYNEFFGIRYETNELMAFSVSDFGGLKCEEHFFTSDKGQKLAGYLYTSDNNTYNDKIVVIAHGFGGGGHNSLWTYAIILRQTALRYLPMTQQATTTVRARQCTVFPRV